MAAITNLHVPSHPWARLLPINLLVRHLNGLSAGWPQRDYKLGMTPSNSALAETADPQAAATGSALSVTDSSGLPTGGAEAIEGFLHLLGRAVKQFHTYPVTSPMCTEALEVCHKAFVALQQSDWLVLRVTPRAFLVDDTPIGSGSVIEHELVHRLHVAHVASLEIEPSVSPRDFTRFCTDVLRSEEIADTKLTFAELLADHGVDTIVPRMAPRPEVLDVGAKPAPVWDLVEHEHRRREEAVVTGPTQYLYPPDKGWVRLDPAAPASSVSLVDMAVLVNDPTAVAGMLLRLTDDGPVSPEDSERALERKFTDVAKLFSALDGPLAQVMFGKLAKAVLTIPEERRQSLLQNTILPGLLDGRSDGLVLRDFPDADLADSLCLLLDLETAAPEVVTAAMHRLELPAERRQAVASLVEERLQRGKPDESAADRDETTDRYAQKLIKVDSAERKSFAEFAAFDLSIDDETAAAIAQVGGQISNTDVATEQIDCLWRLIRLEPNPLVSEVLLRRVLLLLGDLDRADRWADVAAAAAKFKGLAQELREARPDISNAIGEAFAGFCTPSRVLSLLELHEGDEASREVASRLIEALGVALVPRLIAVLDEPSLSSRVVPLTALMCHHAAILAPGLAAHLGQGRHTSARAMVRACGFAGAGYEPVIAEQLTSADEQTVREALRALARIGSPRAAAVVSSHIVSGSPFVRSAAAEALWHFSPSQRAPQLRNLLRRESVVQNPPIASMLIDRAAQSGAADEIKAALGNLEGLRFRFWSPAVMRVAWKARELRSQ